VCSPAKNKFPIGPFIARDRLELPAPKRLHPLHAFRARLRHLLQLRHGGLFSEAMLPLREAMPDLLLF
jgi:hypothetical protein